MLVGDKVFKQRSIIVLILVGIFVSAVASLTVAFLVNRKKIDVDDPVDTPINVLFIVVDDLRPTLGCYGDQRAITPNIDQLAKRSALFANAYAQQALCSPSRTSFLTSRRPDSLKLYDTSHYWRKEIWNFTTLPEHFKDNGYETVSVGKIFHPGIVSGKTDDYPFSWSRKPFHPSTLKYKMQKVCETATGKFMNLVCPVDVESQPEGTLPDLEIVDYALNYLKNKSSEHKHSAPFFLGVGFHKPHIPFKFPKSFLDLYPIEDMNLSEYNKRPAKMPDVAWNPWDDLRLRDDVQKLNISYPYGPIPDDFQKLIRQGYYASTSYMDDQVGKLLEAIEENGYASNTAIVLLGDHGWSLGEHGEWSKYSNFDVAVRVPLLVYVPGITDFGIEKTKFKHIIAEVEKKSENITSLPYRANHVAHEMVELVDLFPTLSEVANIAIPTVCSLNSNKTSFCSEGVSFHAVLVNHANPSIDFTWKTAIFSQYPRPSSEPRHDSDQPKRKNITIMGYTIKDEYFRYTRWVHFDESSQPHWGTFEGHELYDEVKDPNEMNNLADNRNYSYTVIDYLRRLRRGWRWELPYAIFGAPKRVKKQFFRPNL